MFVFCLIFSIIGKSTAIFSPIITKDVGLYVVDMIKNHGYPAEKYHLTTPDDYILEIHRIPYGLSKNNNNSKSKRIILLMHGILGSSVDFVAMGPECALAYILADLDYDVWIGNSRGNLYTRKHAYLDPDIDKRKFWDFSFHEIGYYDLPTIIDFILQITGVDDLYYACLSQGCTAFSVLMATRPVYNSKIRLASLMEPPIIMTHTRSQIVNGLAFNLYLSMALFNNLGVYEATATPLLRKLIIKYCEVPIFQTVCSKLLGLVVGGSGRLTYKEIIPVAATSDLVGVSMKQFYHYAQLLFLNRFAQFDYGIIKNLLVYGKIVPPAYNLSLITAPIALYYSEADTVVDFRDVRTLIKLLPNVTFSYQVPSGDFSHTDYVLSKYAVELVYNKLIETMKQF